ncbi:hypothetical protein LY76DRAFT_197383 [Colletotrichum caudatum]|nr:hypothetical protein LY76DRAFT_197383 [Colletotrichum caudatum]
MYCGSLGAAVSGNHRDDQQRNPISTCRGGSRHAFGSAGVCCNGRLIMLSPPPYPFASLPSIVFRRDGMESDLVPSQTQAFLFKAMATCPSQPRSLAKSNRGPDLTRGKDTTQRSCPTKPSHRRRCGGGAGLGCHAKATNIGTSGPIFLLVFDHHYHGCGFCPPPI